MNKNDYSERYPIIVIGCRWQCGGSTLLHHHHPIPEKKFNKEKLSSFAATLHLRQTFLLCHEKFHFSGESVVAEKRIRKNESK